MGIAQQGGRRERATSAAAVLLAHALIGYLLIAGFGLSFAPPASDALRVFETRTPPPPPPEEEVIPPKTRTREPEGEAAPPNLKSVASPVVAPEPEVKLEVPPPVTAAPVPREGFDRSQGAAPVPGPGTGAGGVGNGTGSGGSGTGSGGGGNGDGGASGKPVARARWVSGKLSIRDYPPALRQAGIGGRVAVHLTVEPSGRVGRCEVAESSGNAELDATTCRLVSQRYRYQPARDAQGRPVRDLVGERHLWFAGRPQR